MPNSIITDQRLQVPVMSALMYDWCHCLICDGTVDHEFGLFMHHMQYKGRTSTSWVELRTFLEEWTQPIVWGNCLYLFTDAANKNNHLKAGFSSSASEFMTIAPLLKRYLRKVVLPRGEETAHVESMVAALDVLELLMRCKRGGVTPASLRKAIEKHLALFKHAYGDDYMRPKHHYILHLPDQLHEHKLLLSTHTNERRHRLALRYTRDRHSLESYDLGATEEVTCHQLWEMEQPWLKFGISETAKPRPLTMAALRDIFSDVPEDQIFAGSEAMLSNGTARNGDFVLIVEGTACRLGELLMLVVVNERELAIVECWDASSAVDTDGMMVFKATEMCSIISLEIVKCPVKYKLSKNKRFCRAYIDPEYRP